MKYKPIVWMLVFLILTTSTLALGIRPAKTTVNFEPGLEKDYVFYIVNNEDRPLTIGLGANGILKDYISFEHNEITLQAEEKLKEVKFKLTLPQALTPGLNLGEITVSERSQDVEPTKITGMISANLQLIHKVFVVAPYPEKYVDVDIRLRIREIESDVITEIKNSGSKAITEALTQIQVFDNNKKIKELKTPPISLQPTQTKQYYLTLSHDQLPEGEYDVNAQVLYDGEELEVTRKLLAGEPLITIINFNKFYLEKEASELQLELENKWNRLVTDIHADIVVKRNNQILYQGKTVSFDLKARGKDVVKTFIDASNIEAGEAQIEITLYYSGKKESRTFDIEFLTKEDFEKTTVITMPGGTFTYIILIIMTLMILAILVVILLPKRKKKEQEKIINESYKPPAQMP